MSKDFQKIIAAKRQELKEKSSKEKNIDKEKYYSDEEAIQKIYQILLKKAKIPKEYINCSFSNFDHNFIPENKEKIERLKKFSLNYHQYFRENRSQQSVVLYSAENGCGKTHIAVSMGKLILWEYAKVIYHKDPFKYRVRGVISDDLRFSYPPVFFMSEKKYIWCKKRFRSQDEKIINYVADCEKAFMNSEIIIYDDLFRSRDTDFFFEELEGIISQRYDENKGFIFTTNYNIYTIDQEDPELNPFSYRVEQGR
ncbi:MAG: hypothetical protein ACOCRX_10165, partial [Candidatus Woesearchaeota archaeon]